MAVAEAVAIDGEPLWDEGIWEELLAYIEEAWRSRSKPMSPNGSPPG